MSLSRRFLFICLVAVVAGTVFVIAIPDSLGWRARVIWAKASGHLPELPWVNLIRWLAPASPVYLEPLADHPNVRSGIHNPLPVSQPTSTGAQLFGRHCASCHGADGKGAMAPDLLASVAHNTDWLFFSTVKWGRSSTAMSPQPLADREIWETHAYLRQMSLRAAGVNAAAAPASPQQVTVDPGSILASNERPHDWLTFAGNYAGHRHSNLSAIRKENVRNLRVAWVAQLRSLDKFLEASPIATSNLAFVTESPDGVVALDATTGETRWAFQRPVPVPELPLCCGTMNRGVAILNHSLFVATLDAHLVSLDATTGKPQWDTTVANVRDGYSMTGAPLALRDRVIVGVSGGEFGIRGFIAAYRESDGHLLWKFNTVPAPGEPGHDTWAGDSWKTGGAPTWTTGAYDEKLNLLYWGVGNPSPPFSRKGRSGDNLFSNSVVALNADTGTLQWYYQFSPADEHDWDSAQQPVLADILYQGRTRAALLWANRNGFFYALDRQTGAFLFAKPFVKQTWNTGFTPDGRPIPDPKAATTKEGTLLWPAAVGATNWWPPSYDTSRRLLYIPAVDAASIYFAGDARPERRRQVEGSATVFAASQPSSASVKAIAVDTGNIRWETVLESGSETLRNVGGVLSTSGGLVFVGYRDELFALDSDTGRTLWRLRLGGLINAPPVSYAVGQTQFIALMAGHTLFTFSLPPER